MISDTAVSLGTMTQSDVAPDMKLVYEEIRKACRGHLLRKGV